MKLLNFLAATSLASAFVIPDASVFNTPVDSFHKTIARIASQAANIERSVKDEFDHVFSQELPEEGDHSSITSEVISFMEEDHSDKTIYELITETSEPGGGIPRFAEIVKKHENITALLNSTDVNLTLFMPTDEAFADIPEDHKKPSKEFVERVLEYHIGIGEYPVKRILSTHTLPTALNESWLGGKPQRLRTSVGFSGIRLNVYSKMVAFNIKCKNGYLHAVSKILVPPAMIGREISLFPGQFSTLLLAYDKTNFVDFIHHVNMIGSTVFAPSNAAWQRLGVRANAFLFNTEEGKKYLKALLKYQIVANTTLYSDEVYYGGEKSDVETKESEHYELKTLLDDKSLGVDIHSWKGWTSMIVNGYIKVGFADGIGKNGVIQVVERVPIPPCKEDDDHGRKYDGEIDVGELKARLQGYVEQEEQEEEWVGEL